MATFALRAPRARRTAGGLFLAAAALALAPGVARGGDATFVLTARVVSVDDPRNELQDRIVVGSRVYGVYTFDLERSPGCLQHPEPERKVCGWWAMPAYQMTVAFDCGYVVYSDPRLIGLDLMLEEDATGDLYLVDSVYNLGMHPLYTFPPYPYPIVALHDSTGTALASTVPTEDAPDLSRFDTRELTVGFGSGAGVRAEIETLERVEVVTFPFTAVVDAVEPGFETLAGALTPGTVLEGRYTYPMIPASAGGGGGMMMYTFPAPPFGISVTGGGLTFQTSPGTDIAQVSLVASSRALFLAGRDLSHPGLEIATSIMLRDPGSDLQDLSLPTFARLDASWPVRQLRIAAYSGMIAHGAVATLKDPPQTLTVTKAGAGSGRVLSMSPAGIDCGNACTLTDWGGTAVTLTAWPAPGSTFTGWTGACTGSARSCTVTLDAATSVGASFGRPAAMSVVAWGSNQFGQTAVPASVGDVLQVSAGEFHSLAVRTDHTVAAWGYGDQGQTAVPEGLDGIAAVAAGGYHSLALRSDGTVVGWGQDTYGAASPPAGLSGVVAVSAGNDHSLALRSDGTVAAWGFNGQGQASVPGDLAGVVAISAGFDHNLALKADGTVVAWGSNFLGERDVPADLSRVVAVAAGDAFSLALLADGTVRAWGGDPYGTGDVNVPAGLGPVQELSACVYRAIALLTDGTVVEWGQVLGAPRPADLAGVTAVSAGQLHALALVPSTSAPTFTLTVAQLGEGGRVTSSDTVPALACTAASCTAKAVVGSTVTLTAASTDPARYVFKRWSGCIGGSGSTCIVPMVADREVAATFEPATFPLTLAYGGTGSGTVGGLTWSACTAAGCTATVPNGAVVTLTAQPGAGNVFEGWGILCAGTDPTCTFTMNSAKTVRAAFDPAAYALSVSLAGAGAGSVTSAPAGIGCGAGGPCAASFANGTTVVLTASWDATRYRFTRWSGGTCAGTAATCTVAMDAAKSVTATFDPLTYPLSVSIGGAGAGTVASTTAVGTPDLGCATGSTAGCTASFANGASVTITATPKDAASVFGAWSGCSSVSGNRCTVAMTSARSVTASFLPASYPLTVSFGGTGRGTVSGTAGGAAIAFTCGTTCTASVANGASVVLSAAASAGSTFKGWGVVCAGASACAFKMNAAKSPLATFSSP